MIDNGLICTPSWAAIWLYYELLRGDDTPYFVHFEHAVVKRPDGRVEPTEEGIFASVPVPVEATEYLPSMIWNGARAGCPSFLMFVEEERRCLGLQIDAWRAEAKRRGWIRSSTAARGPACPEGTFYDYRVQRKAYHLLCDALKWGRRFPSGHWAVRRERTPGIDRESATDYDPPEMLEALP